MYTCVKALLRQRGDNQRLTEAQVSDAAVRTLVTENSVVYLVLSNPLISHQVGLDLSTVETQVYALGETITINQWLTSLGDASLPTTDTLMVAEASVVGYNDIFAAGYTLERVAALAGAGSELPDSELTDILITKADVDYELFYNNVLITVNGLLHQIDSSSAGVRIKDAGMSTWYSNRHDIGMMSFRTVGEVQTIPITEDMILSYNGGDLKNGFLINLPDVDLSSKVVMMSVGGFFHFSNDTYTVVGDSTIKFDWWKYPIESRYYNSRKLIDLRKYKESMTDVPKNGDALDLNEAATDVAIKAYMTLSQSFVILLDADNFFCEKHVLERTGLPGRYYSYEIPAWPMQIESGLLPAYVAMPEAGMYCLAITENKMRRFQHDTHPKSDDQYFNGTRISSNLGYYSSAYLLEMGTDVLVADTTTTTSTASTTTTSTTTTSTVTT
jgi:hypothetical protein